ncbi:MAG: glycosyltransferase family 4 protein [Chlorobiaceae bacterium]|nr:glycosyltransferase family 4 protein [Chlorobiaceae bacterium]
MRKALFLTRHFPPYVTSGASRAWKFALNMPIIGWEAVVVSQPAVAGLDEGSGSSLPMPTLFRTGPDVDLSKLGQEERRDYLSGREVPSLRSFASRMTGIFSDDPEGAEWERGARKEAERLLAEHGDIEILYAQGPPLQPLRLALDIARQRSLTVILDIASPLDPAMPPPGTSKPSAAAKAEEEIMMSGVPMIVPSRAMKEYFLKKYQGRLSNGSMTIVPNGFDDTNRLPAALKQGQLPSAMRMAFWIGEMEKRELKAFIAGLEAFCRSCGIAATGAQLLFIGEGTDALARRMARSPILPIILFDPGNGLAAELDLCRKADFFCSVQGSSPADECLVPDRLLDAMGMRRPICCVAPQGVAEKLVLDAGGITAPPGDEARISEMLATMTGMQQSRTLRAAPEEVLKKNSIAASLREMADAIRVQYV